MLKLDTLITHEISFKDLVWDKLSFLSKHIFGNIQEWQCPQNVWKNFPLFNFYYFIRHLGITLPTVVY